MLIILLIFSHSQLFVILETLNIISHRKKPGLLRDTADPGAAAGQEASLNQMVGRCSETDGACPGDTGPSLKGLPLAKDWTV